MNNRILKTPVHVVKKQICETLSDIGEKLESYYNHQENSQLLVDCQNLLSQVSGSLDVLSLSGARSLCQEMIDLCAAIIDGNIPDLSGALELLIASTLFIPRYLDYVGESQKEHPVLALNTINALRKAHRKTLIPEHVFIGFSYEDKSENICKEESVLNPDLVSQSKRLRHMYQVGLLGVINGNAVSTHLKYMIRALERLETLSATLPCNELPKLGLAVLEAVQETGIQLDTSVKHILGVTDRQIKEYISGDENLFFQPLPDNVKTGLLYYIAKSCIDSGRVKKIKNEYSLFDLVDDEAFIIEQRDRLEAPDRSVIQRVAEEILISIEQVKEQLDQIDRLGKIEDEQGQISLETLEKISVTLMMLDLLHASEIATVIKNDLEKILTVPNRPTPDQIAELADRLVSIEIAVQEFSQGTRRGKTGDRPIDANYSEAIQITIKEARTNLDQVKDSLEVFIQNYMELSSISDIPALLHEVKGALKILEFDLVANIIEGCAEYVSEQILNAEKHPKDSEIETLADTLASIEWYLECFEHYHDTDEGLLDVACESIEELGYIIER